MIRLYRPASDRGALRACVVELQEYERGIEAALPAGEGMADAYLETILARCARFAGAVLVAQEDGAVVGFTSILTAVPAESPDDDPRPYAKITDLAVCADFRGRGIGSELLHKAAEIARESGAACLHIAVLAKNRGARRLYERMGFSDYRVRMVKPLE